MRIQTSKPILSKSYMQSGAALLVTVIIVLVLSVIAVTATNTNQLQHLLVRSTQQKLLVQNQSAAELQAQLHTIVALARASEPPALVAEDELIAHFGYVGELLKQGPGSQIHSSTPRGDEHMFGLAAPTSAQDLQRSVGLSFRRVLNSTEVPNPSPPDDELDEGDIPPTTLMLCYEFELVVESQIDNTPTRSQQHQIFELARLVHAANETTALDSDPTTEQLSGDILREIMQEGECDPAITCQCAWPEQGYTQSMFIKSWWQPMPVVE